MKKALTLGILFVFAIMFLTAACAPGPNASENTAGKDGLVAGFLMGLWHGLISPITFVLSLFEKSIRIYEVHNNGSWYNFGFVLGAGLFLGGGILGHRVRRRRY